MSIEAITVSGHGGHQFAVAFGELAAIALKARASGTEFRGQAAARRAHRPFAVANASPSPPGCRSAG